MLRLQCVSLKAESPPFQSSTQYGEEKRYYNDDIVFKVSTMNGIEFNDEQDGLVKLSVQLSYMNWTSKT